MRRTLIPALSSGHLAEAAWPMTHLTSVIADFSDEYLFKVSDPATDRGLLAALTAATGHSARALAAIAGTATVLLAPDDRRFETREALARADEAVADAARVLRDAADRLTPAPQPAAVTDLTRRGGTRSAALARSTIVSAQPATTALRSAAAPGATVIPLRRGH
ncbi:hypothetical protein ACFV4P_31220 [Kitasatospora sp. NPDC059795]|uniref:hypothetical protein n=1 Tax=Kitasatospora sp. NPDC059795 TaxID=3346949 RepID=UPI003650C786